MTAWLMLVFFGLFLVGCAPTWVQTGRAPTALELDTYECQREADRVPQLNTGPYGGLIFAIAQAGYVAQRRQVVTKCMQMRGYTRAD